ncbi:MAG: nucleotidyltransferase family protein [Chloroflexi bacterium]|nr:nucleotidyltransferase family protein [Chloroflexota bacterium]
MVTRIRIDKKEVEAFCQRWKIAELSVFGSVLRDDFRPDSDVDVLVRFEPSARYGLFAVARMQEELQVILGRPVDLVVRSEIERSRNYIRRKEILGSLEPIYAT